MPKISLQVTAKQFETITKRTEENGFDDITTYVKHAALKVDPFTLSDAGMSHETPTHTIEFDTTDAQHAKIEAKMEAMECDELNTYLTYVALHGVTTVVIEVRSDGSFDDMVARIQKMKEARKNS
jgi:hypothetical protein